MGVKQLAAHPHCIAGWAVEQNMNDAYFKLFTSAYNDTYIMNTWTEKRMNGTAPFANDAARAEVGWPDIPLRKSHSPIPTATDSCC